MNDRKMSLKRKIQNVLAGWYRFLRSQEMNAERHRLVEMGLLQVGRHTYGNPKVWVYEGSEHKAVIGSYCSIAPGVEIITGGIHPTDWVSTYPFRIQWKMAGALQDGMPASRGDVIIGNDVWIGSEAFILSGVTIGHGSVIAARSVVTKDVPPYAMVGGTPAKVLKFRFSPETIEKLLAIQWWNWPEEKIREAVPLLSSNNIDEFLKVYGDKP